MKYLKILLIFALFFSIACTKEQSHKSGYGWLKVTVRFNGIPSPSSIVYLANSLNDLNNQVYIAEATTNYQGIADFGEVKAGSYYTGVTIKVQNSYDRIKNKQITVADGEVTLESLEVN